MPRKGGQNGAKKRISAKVGEVVEKSDKITDNILPLASKVWQHVAGQQICIYIGTSLELIMPICGHIMHRQHINLSRHCSSPAAKMEKQYVPVTALKHVARSR